MQDLLDRLGWSQTHFAEYWGVSRWTVAKWCKGDPQVGAMKHLTLLCRLMGVDDE